MKPIILVPLVALALVGGSAGAYLAVTSEGSVEEAVIAQATPTPAPAEEALPTPTPGSAESPGGGGGGGEGTVVPILTPFPSPAPVPESWPTYTDPEGRFTVRYPSGWYVDPTNRRVLSWDPSTWNDRDYPPNGILVEISVSSKPTDASEFRPSEATDTAFAGEPAWEIITVYPAVEPGRVTRSHAVVATHDGYAFSLVAFFAQEKPDEVLFSQIVSSFRFIG